MWLFADRLEKIRREKDGTGGDSDASLIDIETTGRSVEGQVQHESAESSVEGKSANS